MPQVNVVMTSWGRNSPAGNMGIQVEGVSQVYTLYSTPAEGVYEPGVAPIVETDRPGFQPLTTPRGQGLRTYQFEHRIFHPSPIGNVDHELKFLQGVAEKGKRVKFFNTSALAMDRWYWVRECKITEEEKGTGHKTRSAMVSWTVVEANRVNPVDWSRTAFRDQPPIRIEAHGPEKAETSTDTVKNDKEDGPPRGTITESVEPSGGGGGDWGEGHRF